jgi:hypothetical protein
MFCVPAIILLVLVLQCGLLKALSRSLLVLMLLMVMI